MSTLNTSIQLTELDFDSIKQDLREFLEQQTTFTGYDFDGSGLNVLLNLLAYNTSYVAFLAAMLGNESFLDTSELRSSVISHAKALGYTPRSITAPTATIALTVTPTSDLAALVIEKETVFTTTVDGTTYNYSPIQDYTAVKSGSQFSVSSMSIKEGTWQRFTYIVDSQNEDQRFVVPDKNADTSTLLVTIQESISDSTQTTYTKSTDITTLTSTSTVYFLEENEDGFPEIRFGDGTVGKSPHDRNLVIIEYLTTSGAASNGASTFLLATTISGDSTGVITTSSAAAGGSAAETVESVRFLAPRYFQSQNRAVTSNDYETIIKQNFADIDAVRVWGGEDGDPRTTNNDPAYGKVFIALRAKTNFTVTDSMKSTIKNTILSSKNLVSVIPEFIDPDYMYIIPTVTITYNTANTNKSSAEMTSLVTTAVSNYAADNLTQFSDTLRYSKLLSAIDDSETSIVGSLLSLKLRKSITPTVGVATEYSIKFQNALLHPENNYPSNISSTSFTYLDPSTSTNVTAYLQDRNGVVQIYKLSGGSRVVIVDNAGTITYSTGKIVLTEFNPVSISGTTLDITVTPKKNDIVPSQNTLLAISDADISVTVETV